MNGIKEDDKMMTTKC